MKIRMFLLLLIVCCASTAGGQTLAGRVPSDAVAYVGWKGADSADTGYAGSHLQAVVDASGFAQVRDEVIPQVMQKIVAQSDDHGEGALAAKTILNILWRRPSAVFFAGMTQDANGQDSPKMGLICQAGTDSDALMTILNAGVHGPNAAPMARAFVTGDCTVFLLGYSADSAIPAANSLSQTLEGNAEFQRMTAEASKSSMVSIYVNAARGFSLIDDAVQKNANAEAVKTIWPKVRDASGLLGIKHISMSAGFEGKDWQTQSYVDAPAPRSGLLSIVEPSPIDPQLLSRVPATATATFLGQFDFGALIRQARLIAVAGDPNAGDLFDKAMGMVQMMVGRNLQRDILEPLGTQWAMYTDGSIPFAVNSTTRPSMNGSNVIVVNKLVDPAKALQGWTMLSYAISNASAGYVRAQHLPVTMSMTKNGEENVFTVVTPYGQPSWTIHDGFMYFGLSAQGVVNAANRAGGPPVTETPEFISLAKQLMPSGTAGGFDFADLPKSFPQSYPAIEQFVQKFKDLAKQQSIALPEHILPPLDKITAELSPALGLSWADASGWHSKSRSPLPGVSASPDTLAVGGGALVVSIILPSLNRARETANRIKCASNERQMGQAILLYANDHKGDYPPTVGDMMREEDLTAQVFLCPSSHTSLPGNLAPADLIAWTQQHTDYVYAGKGMKTTAGADAIAVYEKPDDHTKDGMNILFGDGHVEFMTLPNAVRLIKAQNKTVPEVPLPDIAPAPVP